MPPKKRSNLSSSSNSIKKPKEKHNVSKRKPGSQRKLIAGRKYLVEEIIDLRVDPDETSDVKIQVKVKWHGYDDSQNSWEPIENYRENVVFREFLNKYFDENEMKIYVTIINYKERIKERIQKVMDENPKFVIMQNVFPFDPFQFKVFQVLACLHENLPKIFYKKLKQLVFQNYFFKRDEDQRVKLDNLAEKISKKENIQVSVVNDIDFELPPSFEYVVKNFTVDNFEETVSYEVNENTCKGCNCGLKKCNSNTNCCPQLVSEPFAYRKGENQSIIMLDRQEEIIECGDSCKCDLTCINRGSQHLRDFSLCLFKTENQGWGVKNDDYQNKTRIKHGTFIIEYTGELIGCYEASKRQVSSFLFDLNMERRENGYYTIDAYKHGSLARFINHSCDPNASIWFVNDCLKNPKKRRLCIFADRDIPPGEEITIDYCPKDNVPVSKGNEPGIVCNCGSLNCRGVIY